MHEPSLNGKLATFLKIILSKIPEQRKPPRRRSLTLATKQNTLYNFRFARATQKFF